MSSLLDEGLRHHNAGDLEKAEQIYLDAVAANSSDAQALKLLAVLQAERGLFDDAVSYAEAAVNLLPDDGECAHLFGRIRIERGEFKAAVPVLRQATQKSASNPAVWADFGLCLERTSAWIEAKAAFEKVLEVEAHHRAAIHGLARVAHALGDVDLAEKTFKRATDMDADDAEAWVGLAKVEQHRGNLEAALKHAEHACSISPDFAPCTAAREDIQDAINSAADSAAGTKD
jgi:tetratricopeptide (TPR) repeat protein